MPVLVDGDNLLFAARAIEEAGNAVGRSMLCEALGAWARRTGRKIHVVFDGRAPTDDVIRQIGDVDIGISFSGVGRSADDLLGQMLQDDSAARRILVVSSDRAVRKAASSRRARSIRSDEFWMGLRQDLARPQRPRVEPEEKRSGLQDEDAGEWLRLFGFDDE